MERLTELKYNITKLDAKIKNMQERIGKMAFDDKAKVGIKFLASTVSYLNELREYKQLEEQGLLLRLPCKVEDTILYVDDDNDNYPIEAKITRIEIKENYIIYYAEEKEDCGTLGFDSDDIGKTVFLTKEEAEQKLKEMESK